MGLPGGLSSCPLEQDELRVAVEARSGIYKFRELALEESRPQTMDYELWDVLEDMACRKQHKNLESLKRSIVKAVAENPLETLRAAISQWSNILKACVEAESSHFEWCYHK